MPRAPFLALSAVLLSAGGAATAQGSAAETYQRCLTDAAMQASYTNAPDDEIYRIARGACADARAAALAVKDRTPSYLAAMDAADADKAKNFPTWIKGVRERRRHEQAQRGGQ